MSTFDERNRQLTEGAATSAWEPRGTLASRTDSNGTVASAFDAFDRQIKHGVGTYAYDGLDRTVSRNGQDFEYDGGSRDLVSDGANAFARGVGGELLAQRTSSGTAQLALTDAHMDVVGGLDPAPSGNLTGSMTYGPFGERGASTGTSGPLGYQSDYTDPATGAVDMGARWYTPGTGTFTTRDDIDLPGSPSIAGNRYTYGNGSPLGNIDPDGHVPWWCYIGGLGTWASCKIAGGLSTGNGRGPGRLAPAKSLEGQRRDRNSSQAASRAVSSGIPLKKMNLIRRSRSSTSVAESSSELREEHSLGLMVGWTVSLCS